MCQCRIRKSTCLCSIMGMPSPLIMLLTNILKIETRSCPTSVHLLDGLPTSHAGRFPALQRYFWDPGITYEPSGPTNSFRCAVFSYLYISVSGVFNYYRQLQLSATPLHSARAVQDVLACDLSLHHNYTSLLISLEAWTCRVILEWHRASCRTVLLQHSR